MRAAQQVRSRRARRPRSALGVVAAGLLVTVSGCGTDLSPGAAATVDGTVITDTTVDDLTQAACDFTSESREQQDGAASGGDAPSLVLADLKASLLQALIEFELTDTAAEELDVEVTRAQISQLTAQQPVPEGLADEASEIIGEFFEMSAKNQLQRAVIGAKLRDPSLASPDDATEEDLQAANDYLQDSYSDADVEVSPRFGRWDGATLEQGTGSLSDPVSTTAAEEPIPGQVDPQTDNPADDLPPSQVCG